MYSYDDDDPLQKFLAQFSTSQLITPPISQGGFSASVPQRPPPATHSFEDLQRGSSSSQVRNHGSIPRSAQGGGLTPYHYSHADAPSNVGTGQGQFQQNHLLPNVAAPSFTPSHSHNLQGGPVFPDCHIPHPPAPNTDLISAAINEGHHSVDPNFHWSSEHIGGLLALPSRPTHQDSGGADETMPYNLPYVAFKTSDALESLVQSSNDPQARPINAQLGVSHTNNPQSQDDIMSTIRNTEYPLETSSNNPPTLDIITPDHPDFQELCALERLFHFMMYHCIRINSLPPSLPPTFPYPPPSHITLHPEAFAGLETQHGEQPPHGLHQDFPAQTSIPRNFQSNPVLSHMANPSSPYIPVCNSESTSLHKPSSMQGHSPVTLSRPNTSSSLAYKPPRMRDARVLINYHLLDNAFKGNNPLDPDRRNALDKILTSTFLAEGTIEPIKGASDDNILAGTELGFRDASIYTAFIHQDTCNLFKCTLCESISDEQDNQNQEHDQRRRKQRRVFERIQRALGHVRSHFGHRPFPCNGVCGRERCSIRCFSEAYLVEHRKTVGKSRTAKVASTTPGSHRPSRNAD